MPRVTITAQESDRARQAVLPGDVAEAIRTAVTEYVLGLEGTPEALANLETAVYAELAAIQADPMAYRTRTYDETFTPYE